MNIAQLKAANAAADDHAQIKEALVEKLSQSTRDAVVLRFMYERDSVGEHAAYVEVRTEEFRAWLSSLQRKREAALAEMGVTL